MAKRYKAPPAQTCVCGDHVWRLTTRGFVNLVSPEDAVLLDGRNWYAGNVAGKGRKPVVYGMQYRDDGKTAYLHRAVAERAGGDLSAPQVDHRNGAGVDNRRGNLRPADRSQNGFNRVMPEATSRFKGVSFVKSRKHLPSPWCANIGYRGANYALGYYAAEESAALAYNLAALELAGEYSCINHLTEGELRTAKTAITYIQHRVKVICDRIAGAASSTPSGPATGSSRTATARTRPGTAASM